MIVSGKIVDNEMGIIPFAEVSVLGTGQKVVANQDGDFFLVAPSSEAVLVISGFPGYASRTMKAKEFNGSYIMLQDGVQIDNNYKKPGDNTLLYAALAVAGAVAVYHVTKNSPRKVKI